MRFSVVIPAFNEALIIGDCIHRVRAINADAEIIVADGGSTDRTAEIARENEAIVTISDRGRGTQQNAGADIATGDILVFLHVDSVLPEDTFTVLETFFKWQKVNIGTFRLRFDHPHWLLKIYTIPVRFDLTFTRFGDQCIVVRRSFFQSTGGFSNLRLFEDLQFINRARKHTRIYRFPGYVTTSARRFLRNGVVRQQLTNMWFTLLYFFRVPPDKLASRYEESTNTRKKALLKIFARYPAVGTTKRRLGADIGDENASELYRLCAEHVFGVCERLGREAGLQVSFASEQDAIQGNKWVSPLYEVNYQSGGDLGERLTGAFQEGFSSGFQKVFVVASDVPQLSPQILRAAIKHLDEHDVVIGPCQDGGYYLIGMKKLYRELFDGIAWSTDKVYQQTLDKINRMGLSVFDLPVLIDIDTQEDLKLWFDSGHHADNSALTSLTRDLLSRRRREISGI